MAELIYMKVGDYYIPDLILDEEPEEDVFYGKYGDLRCSYLREHKHRLWAVLVNNGTADEHLKSSGAAHGCAPAIDDESRWRDRGTESP